MDSDLDEVISQAEGQRALPKLSNGKATGRAGWPAELRRYAASYPEDGKKVWILAPLLCQLLNTLFFTGSVPACIRCKGGGPPPLSRPSTKRAPI